MIDPKDVRRLLDYDPETGLFKWRERGNPEGDPSISRWNGRFAGREAITCINAQGYKTGRMLGRAVRANRLAWAHFYGVWPEHEVDHIDHDKTNDRIANLREVTNAVNSRNMAKSPRNKTGHTGVSICKSTGRYRVKVCNKHFGYFGSMKEAGEAARSARADMGFHQNHGT